MPPRIRLALGWGLLCALLGGCPDATTAPVQRDACNLTAGHLIAHDAVPHYDGQAVQVDAQGALAVWSNRRGTFARRLARDGAPLGSAQRIADRCEGGVALATDGKRRWLGCLRPDQGAYVLMLAAGGGVQQSTLVGDAGRDSRGIALTDLPEGWAAAWHDGTPSAYRVWLAESDARGSGAPSSARVVSDPAFAASAPSLARDGDRYALAWSEMRFDSAGSSSTRVSLARAGCPPTSLGETPVHEPDPQLVIDGQERWLGFRSKAPGKRSSQLFVVALSADLKPRSAPVRVGRANTLSPPVVRQCAGLRFASMSRMYGGERFLAVHPLDDQLESMGGGYQYYANAREFVGVAADCQRDGMLLLAAERTLGLGDHARLMAATLRCK